LQSEGKGRPAVKPTPSFVRCVLFIFVGCLFLLGTPPVTKADAVAVQLSSAALTTTSGGTVTFMGTVTNNSGTDQDASSYFFNFFGFDPSVTPTQDLGLSDFLIPDTTTSGTVSLFDVTLPAALSGSVFSIQFQLQDLLGNQSLTQTVTVTVGSGGSSAVPEPASALLLLVGAGGIVAVHKRFGFSHR
jgi:hypothetical protein